MLARSALLGAGGLRVFALVGRTHEVERRVVQPPGGEGSPVGRGVHPEPTTAVNELRKGFSER